MPGLINPEIVGMARVRDGGGQGHVMSFDFSNGFETGTPEGATAGADPIQRVGTGDYVLFLDDPVQYGDAGSQGGLVASVMSAEIGSDTPAVAFGTVAHGDVAGIAAAYANVDPLKVLRVRFYDGAVPAAVDIEAFTILVHRNPVTVI